MELIAAKTIELLLRKITTDDYSPEHIVLDNYFMERCSVAKIEGKSNEGSNPCIA